MKLVIRRNFKWGFAILLLLFLFQDAISTVIPTFSFFDELESIFMFILIIWSCRKKICIDYYQKMYLITFGIVLGIGLIGNIISGYQSLPYILLDVLVYSKFTINLFAAKIIFGTSNIRKYEDTAWKVASIVSVILCLLVFHEQFFTPIWQYMSDRYGVRSLRLFFSNQTYLALMGVCLLTIHYCCGENRKGNTFFYILDMLISISTFRTKALGFVMLSALIIFFVGRKKKITTLNILCIGTLLVIAVLLVGYEYLDIYYLSGNETIRLAILKGGMELANIYKPFGVGLATYCSLGAKLNYSQAYTLLGMQSIYQWDSMYDNFWASIIGELGYLGFFAYLALIVWLVILVIQIRKYNTRRFWVGIMLCAYLVIASLGESSFNAFYVCFMGVFIGYLYEEFKVSKMKTI